MGIRHFDRVTVITKSGKKHVCECHAADLDELIDEARTCEFFTLTDGHNCKVGIKSSEVESIKVQKDEVSYD